MIQRFIRQPGRKKILKKGESLVEVIMAIFVVAMGSAVATSLIISALQSNQFSRDNLIALNLAVEGMEAMRSIRDANWLKYSYDKPNCWNLFPDSTLTSCADAAAKPIPSDKYTVDLNLTKNQYGWGITHVVGSALDLNNSGNEKYVLKFYDIDPLFNSDGANGPADDKNLMASITSTGGTALSDSRFYRMIEVTYPPANPPACNTATGKSCEEMDVVSTVQWKSQNVTHQVVLTSKLTNYQTVKVK